MGHPVGALLGGIAAGHPPAPDGTVSVLPPPDERSHGVLAFTAHHVVLTDLDAGWVRARLPPGDLSAPLNPPFLSALEAATGRRVNNIDQLLVTRAEPAPAAIALSAVTALEHARVARANRYRTDVRIWTCEHAMVLLGRGVAGRWEVAVEVDECRRGTGLGRVLFAEARLLLAQVAGAGEPLWAQVAPANAASVRAILAAGYRPAGAEALLVGHA